MLPAQPNQSLIDGVTCLQLLAGSKHPLGVHEIARQLDLEPTRVHRLLRTLGHMGLLRQDASRKFVPGPGVHVLAAQCLYGSRLIHAALPVLESLRGEKKFIVAMGVLWRDKVSYLYHAGPDTPAMQGLGRAALYPAVQSGLGLAMLALKTPAELKTTLGGAAGPEAKALIADARTHGYGCSAYRDGRVRSLAVAIADEGAALGFSGVFTDRQIPRMVRTLSRAVDDIRSNLEAMQS